MRELLKSLYLKVTHYIGRLTKRYYFEDYIRVYPGEIVYNRFGRKVKAAPRHIKNYLNHRKFYDFVAQFARDKVVADIGCGSGYGSDIIKKSGAAEVFGCDISTASVRFAQESFPNSATFSVQGITDLHEYKNQSFDLVVSSEVLEHIKEYNLEDAAIRELHRITRPHGLVIVGTPNSELLGDHGFYFREIDELFKRYFAKYCIFENALVPFEEKELREWETRKVQGAVGVIVSESLNLDETYLPDNYTSADAPETKKGIPPGNYLFDGISINTSLLHNTHSWVVVARKE